MDTIKEWLPILAPYVTGAGGLIVVLWSAMRNHRRINDVSDQVGRIEITINGRMTKMMALVEEKARSTVAAAAADALRPEVIRAAASQVIDDATAARKVIDDAEMSGTGPEP